jgi:hypothetical protein
MFYKVVAENNLKRLTQVVEDLLHAGWIISFPAGPGFENSRLN